MIGTSYNCRSILMSEKSEKSFPSWDSLYKSQKVQTMPWYNENLDTDLEEELERRKITKGRILDLGTGPATQAIQLSKRGLNVTGSDISEAAINRAKEAYASYNNNIDFIIDDILSSKLMTTILIMYLIEAASM
jgi:methylase of polypeptide subunit release factors